MTAHETTAGFDPAAPPPRLQVALSPAERPVELAELHVSVEASGALAVTTWVLVFYNPNDRVLEGQLEFPLLEGQAVTRFAMDVDGELREAVPVPKDKGRQVFEEIERRQVDPGLLEKTAGNNYRARVYPLSPGQPKRVVIAYQEELGVRGGAPTYRLALDLPTLRRFSFELALGGSTGAPVVTGDTMGLALPAFRPGAAGRAERADFAARGRLEIALPPGERPAIATQEFEGELYFRAEQALALRSRPRPAPRVLGLAWDSSGSGAGRDVGRELALLERYFRALPRPLEVRLVRLRDVAEPTEVFRIEGGDWSALRRALEETRWDGATALGAFRPEPGVDAWLFCSDGLSNFGDPGAEPDTGGAPLHVLLSAGRADPARLRALADRSGGEFVDLLELPPERALERLLHETERLLAIDASPREVAQVFPRAPSPLRSSRLVLAGMLRAEAATLRARVGFTSAPDEARVVEVVVREGEGRGRLAARAWAALKIEALEPHYESNQADIEWTGQAFGIVTRSTSLIILDSVEDYARYDIAPPAGLRAAWERLRQGQWRAQDEGRARRLERVVGLFREYVAWWERDFPKQPAPPPPPAPKGGARPSRDRGAPVDGSSAPPAPGMAMSPAAAFEDDDADEAPALASMAALPRPAPAPAAIGFGGLAEAAAEPQAEGAGGATKQAKAAIQLQKWTPDAPYLARLGRAPGERLYDAYLEERGAYARSTAFFLDVADLFFERGQPALALRVLSNLAEMELENPAVLRILGYRLLQAGRPDLARPVFEQVKALRPEEPQSFRDLAQACAALGNRQAAVELLWGVVTGEWDSRFPDVELIALVELNALAATSPQPLDLSRIDPRLVRSLPLDLRVVLTWDADNTDIDLWVTDPLGEKAYFANRLSYQGGRVSPDFRDGYGPEEYSLREALPGDYKVEANFYGNRQQIIAGATTVQLQFVTRFGTPEAHEQRVTLRLREARDVVTVGHFKVEAAGRRAGPS